MTQTNIFGELLREYRKAKDIKLGRLAGMLGVPASNLSDVELGRRPPLSGLQIARCAQMLELDTGEIDALFRAASAWRGAFELPVSANPSAMDLGAALMREWPSMTTDVFQQINRVVAEHAAKKSKE